MRSLAQGGTGMGRDGGAWGIGPVACGRGTASPAGRIRVPADRGRRVPGARIPGRAGYLTICQLPSGCRQAVP